MGAGPSPGSRKRYIVITIFYDPSWYKMETWSSYSLGLFRDKVHGYVGILQEGGCLKVSVSTPIVDPAPIID